MIIFIAPMAALVTAYITIIIQSGHLKNIMPINRKRSQGTTDRIKRSKKDEIDARHLACGDVSQKDFTYDPTLRKWTFHNIPK